MHANHIGLTSSKNENFTYWAHGIFFWEFCDVKKIGKIFPKNSKIGQIYIRKMKISQFCESISTIFKSKNLMLHGGIWKC
jgi:hypothetical protein